MRGTGRLQNGPDLCGRAERLRPLRVHGRDRWARQLVSGSALLFAHLITQGAAVSVSGARRKLGRDENQETYYYSQNYRTS